MAGLRRFLQRIVSAARHDRAEDDLAREVASHLALLEEQFQNDGMTLDEARLAARRAFGGVEQAKEHQRDARAFRWIADLRQDLTYGARSFARSPGFCRRGRRAARRAADIHLRPASSRPSAGRRRSRMPASRYRA
jgi:hypothetical protein